MATGSQSTSTSTAGDCCWPSCAFPLARNESRFRRRAPLPTGSRCRAASSFPIKLAGDHIAYLGSAASGRNARLNGVLVADWRSGAIEATIALRRVNDDVGFDDLDLSPDGRAVVAVDGRLLTAAPGQQQRLVAGSRGRSLYRPRLVGQRMVVQRETVSHARPLLLDSQLGTLRPVGPRSTAIEEIEADEQGVAWLANGCLLAAGLDDPPFAAPPPGPCPRAEVVLDEGDQLLRGRTVRIVVACIAAPPSGCRGTVRLRRASILGRGSFAIAPGQRRLIPVVLTRRGLSYHTVGCGARALRSSTSALRSPTGGFRTRPEPRGR